MKTNSTSRLFYIDNLRIFLISLVVLHHLAITNGAPGGWYYNESQAEFPAIIPLSVFVASNQAFFMGMFFFISAYFILPSLLRKGTKVFLKKRLVRLGIPLLIFYFFLYPLTIYIRNKFILAKDDTFTELFLSSNEWGFGPMWFVEVLLIFTIAYLLFRLVKKKIILPFTSTYKIYCFSTPSFIGLLSDCMAYKTNSGRKKNIVINLFSA